MNLSHDQVFPYRLAQDGTGITQLERHIPVRRKVDVLVCGGGPAGVGAALAAAREGASVLMLERFAVLGGMWTGGLVNPLFEADCKGYMVEELVRRLQDRQVWRKWLFAHSFDVDAMRCTLEDMFDQERIEILYYTLATDVIVEHDTVRGVVIESKAGREAVMARVVIDATGDGDIAARAGCGYETGRPADGACQPSTLMFEISGAGHFDQKSGVELYDLLAEAAREKGMALDLPYGRCGYAPWIVTLPGSVSAVQSTHIYHVNALDPADLTRGMLEGARQAEAFVNFLRIVPGFEHIRLTRLASVLGVRESRRIIGRACVTLRDALEGSSFSDGIALSGFGIDVHSQTAEESRDTGEEAPGCGDNDLFGRTRPFEIPYGCLLPADVEGLLVAGRCISGDSLAHASYRVTGTAMATGQAAGLAAAESIRQNTCPSALDGRGIRRMLQERGVPLS